MMLTKVEAGLRTLTTHERARTCPHVCVGRASEMSALAGGDGGTSVLSTLARAGGGNELLRLLSAADAGR